MANKIIIVTGPREGVGKTTLAANIAMRYAQLRRQPVILVDSDPWGRDDLGQLIGANSSFNVMQVLEQLSKKQASLPMLRGRVPLTKSNIGVVTLAPTAREIERLTPQQFTLFLQTFVQLYDIVIDMEAWSPLKTAALDIADLVLWTLTPNSIAIRSTVQHLEALHAQKFGFYKFLFVLNQVGQGNAIEPEVLSQVLERFDKQIDIEIPFEPQIGKLMNDGAPILVENVRSPYTQKVLTLIERFGRYQRDPKASSSSEGPSAASGGTPKASATAALQSNVVDAMLQEKRDAWNAMKQQLHRDLVDELNLRRIDLDTKGDPARERQLRTNVENTVNSLIAKTKDLTLSREEREKVLKELVDEALGLGPLEELLRDPSITEIMVNRFNQVYVERRGKIVLSDKRFIDNNHVIQVIRRIIAPLGRRIDESIPMVDARLRDGSRVNAIIPPLAVQGPTLTIRRFPDKAFAAEDLVRINSVTPEMIKFLDTAVLLKRNIIISGGTGTGKTTILNLLSAFIPGDERIVTVEDTAELRMQQEHVVRLEARPANIEGQGMVSIRDLVKNCLRMRPDRIVVGECRGGEALDMLQAMNTGHEGSLTTIHANTPRDAFNRLETLCLMAGMDLPVWALREQIRAAVHLVVQLTRMQDGSRKVTCITEVIGRGEEGIQTHDLFRYVQDGVDAEGKVFGHHEATGNLPTFLGELRSKGLALDVQMFAKKGADGPPVG